MRENEKISFAERPSLQQLERYAYLDYRLSQVRMHILSLRKVLEEEDIVLPRPEPRRARVSYHQMDLPFPRRYEAVEESA